MHDFLLLKYKNNREVGRLSLFMARRYLASDAIMEDNFGANETAYYLFLEELWQISCDFVEKEEGWGVPFYYYLGRSPLIVGIIMFF